MTANQDRYQRLVKRAADKRKSERAAELKLLRERDDFIPELSYFASLYDEEPTIENLQKRVDKPVCAVLCLQAPLEIFQAQGFFPVKIYSGSYGAANLTSPRLPALMCPALKAVLGETELDPGLLSVPWVIPLTCDWVVKFRETRELFGEFPGPVHFLEVPRVKESRGSKERWFYEINALSGFLRKTGGVKLKRKNLMDSLEQMERARRALSEFTSLRREGRIASVLFTMVAGSFFFDKTENWIGGLLTLNAALLKKAKEKNALTHSNPPNRNPDLLPFPGDPEIQEPRESTVFLSGSPIFFPNYKILHLLEDAGLKVVGDDLCSSERLFPRHVEASDTSEEGLLRALADAYHRGCLCPVFAENFHRASIIKEAREEAEIKGVIFHLLKGCHPYELDSFSLEESLKDWGLKYLKIETDYSVEDSQNLLTRLEAFRPTLETEEEKKRSAR
jgi:benzoyl-CoA reductase/2-hydroxyglutaryl-CoA dehydratase subunit BcrC/BadD/HgdB